VRLLRQRGGVLPAHSRQVICWPRSGEGRSLWVRWRITANGSRRPGERAEKNVTVTVRAGFRSAWQSSQMVRVQSPSMVARWWGKEPCQPQRGQSSVIRPASQCRCRGPIGSPGRPCRQHR
jgi:hypothetical protein